MGLVGKVDRDRWDVSDAASVWLQNSDDLDYLAGIIHAHTRFFGELLASVQADTTHDDLLTTARSTYGLQWEKLDPVRRRAGWLRSLGMLELWGNRLVVTSRGRELLDRLQLASPSDTRPADPDELDLANDADPAVAAAPLVKDKVAQLDSSRLANRREPIGYIPRGAKRTGGADSLTPIEGLRRAVGVLGDAATIEDFKSRVQSELGVYGGSFTTMLHALRHMDFVELVAYNKYGPTDSAYACLEPGREADLVRFFHAKFSFFGELIHSCPDWTTTSQLLSKARSGYGFEGDAAEIRTRIALLADAGMLLRFDKTRVRASPAGRDMLEELPLQRPRSTIATSGEPEEPAAEEPRLADSQPSRLDDVVERLRRFGKNGAHSSDFEIAVGEAIELLGLRVSRISGSSDTDVLAWAELPPDQRFRVIFEAKATSSSAVPESQVNFEGIKRHWKKNKADFAAMVGIGFPRAVIDSAHSNGVAIITVEDLVSLVQRHADTPVSLESLKQAFSPGLENLAAVDPAYVSLDNEINLIGAIISILKNEAIEDDPEDQGYVSVENLRWALRTVDLSFRPNKDQVRQALDFLAHPMVGAIATSKSGTLFALADDPRNIIRRLSALSDRVASFVPTDDS